MKTSDDIIVYLSDIAFDIVDGLSMFPNEPCVRILIDGMPMVEMVRNYEKKMLAGTKEASLAGSYWYIHPDALIKYLESGIHGEEHRIALIGCTCLEEDCWPLRCSVEKQAHYIIWHDFYQPHRRQWDYSGFGPFCLKRQQLLKTLNRL